MIGGEIFLFLELGCQMQLGKHIRGHRGGNVTKIHYRLLSCGDLLMHRLIYSLSGWEQEWSQCQRTNVKFSTNSGNKKDFIYLFIYLFIFVCLFFETGFSLYPFLSWKSFYTPCWARNQKSACLRHPSAGIKVVHPQHLGAGTMFFSKFHVSPDYIETFRTSGQTLVHTEIQS